MTRPEADRLYVDPDLADFYDVENDWTADNVCCAALAQSAGSVLDLGCGTGLFLTTIADGRPMTGVDPANAMLDIARHRPKGELVRWTLGDMRTVRLDAKFDLIVMTGHAFQCLLTDEDVASALATIAAHLSPNGQFIFDSRNPLCREWEQWTPELSRRALLHPVHGAVESWNDIAYDAETGVASYDTVYKFNDGRLLTARSSIRFMAQPRLAALIAEAGLAVDTWLGDWNGGPYSAQSKEIIPQGRLGQLST